MRLKREKDGLENYIGLPKSRKEARSIRGWVTSCCCQCHTVHVGAAAAWIPRSPGTDGCFSLLTYLRNALEEDFYVPYGRVQTQAQQREPFAAGAASESGSFLEDEMFHQYVGEMESSAHSAKIPVFICDVRGVCSPFSR